MPPHTKSFTCVMLFNPLNKPMRKLRLKMVIPLVQRQFFSK